MTIRLIGVPFDGMGRRPGQAGAPAALRAAGLEAALSSHKVVSQPDLTLPEARAERAPQSGLLNETALVKMVAALYAEVSGSLSVRVTSLQRSRLAVRCRLPPGVQSTGISQIFGCVPAKHNSCAASFPEDCGTEYLCGLKGGK